MLRSCSRVGCPTSRTKDAMCDSPHLHSSRAQRADALSNKGWELSDWGGGKCTLKGKVSLLRADGATQQPARNIMKRGIKL